MRIIMDTGVFFRPTALRELAGREEDLILPAVAYAERLRQIVSFGQSEEQFDQLLDEIGCLVEPFAPAQAKRFVPGCAKLPDSQWRRLARDAMIAGHLQPGDQLWTTNGHDFQALGVARSQVVEVPSS